MPTENQSSNTEKSLTFTKSSLAAALESVQALHEMGCELIAGAVFQQAADHHQGEQVDCDHEWTDDGEFLLVCTNCGAQEDHNPGWRDMETAPRDGSMLRLLVEFTDHSTEDEEQAATIGANNFDNDGEDSWQFAGWCWDHDHFTEGKGTPVGWLPMLDTPNPVDNSEVERLVAANTEYARRHLEQQAERLRAEVKLLRSDLRIANDTVALGVKMLAERDERAEFEAAYLRAVERGWSNVKHLARQLWDARAALERKP
ncbi:hypothetical protein [Pseudomonas asplenii]|uniref:hypothetical protein n=1 Tax=Pseudomonas asplenii TaxID=53407 RepID=UPI0006B59C7B|nr:hypothetical protein [Pseudomonas fuscovaginae]KPA95401.1 hypothetical protein PF70_04587 [Pseudomonas fuscovaginae]